MFKNRTVFILGAGASWHYGYPTGEDLVTAVIAKAKHAAEGFDILGTPLGVMARPSKLIVDKAGRTEPGALASASREVARECKDVASRLEQVRPPVIDYYLGHNPKITDMAKLLVAWVIQDCEAADNGQGNQNRVLKLENSPYENEREKKKNLHKHKFRDNWYRFIVNKIVSGCEKAKTIHENQVYFVTFNYDTSLEHHLFASLRAYDLFKDETIPFLSSRILHVYGQISEKEVGVYNQPVGTANLSSLTLPNVTEAQTSSVLAQFNSGVDRAYMASGGIRVIGPAEKGENEKVLNDAKSAIQNAICVYILGYGFDESNSRLLNLREHLEAGRAPYKAVMFTNFDNINRVNKKASMIFFGNYSAFLDPTKPIYGDPKDWYVEKSTRDVYDALELDFESLEQQLLAGSPM